MGRWGSMMKGLRGMATSTAPKMKAAKAELHDDLVGGRSHKRPGPKKLRGDFVPVYVAVGLVALSTMFGLHSAKQQLLYGPNVFVRKRRRETLPEVVEPEHVLDETEKFVAKSFFRRLAHVQDPDHDYVVKDTTRGDAFAHPVRRAETLKSVGVEPDLPPVYENYRQSVFKLL